MASWFIWMFHEKLIHPPKIKTTTKTLSNLSCISSHPSHLNIILVVVSTHMKNISQIGSSPQEGFNIFFLNHHLVMNHSTGESPCSIGNAVKHLSITPRAQRNGWLVRIYILIVDVRSLKHQES